MQLLSANISFDEMTGGDVFLLVVRTDYFRFLIIYWEGTRTRRTMMGRDTVARPLTDHTRVYYRHRP